MLLFLIPIGGLGAVAVIGGMAAGLTWNLYTITIVVVAGAIAIFSLLYVISLISVPAVVFFPGVLNLFLRLALSSAGRAAASCAATCDFFASATGPSAAVANTRADRLMRTP